MSISVELLGIQVSGPPSARESALERMRTLISQDLASLQWSGSGFSLPTSLDAAGRICASVRCDDTLGEPVRDANQVLAIANKLSLFDPKWVFSVSDDGGVLPGPIHIRDGAARLGTTKSARVDEVAERRLRAVVLRVPLSAIPNASSPAAKVKATPPVPPSPQADPDLDAFHAAIKSLNTSGDEYALGLVVEAASPTLRHKMQRAALVTSSRRLWHPESPMPANIFLPPLAPDVVRSLAAILLDARKSAVGVGMRTWAAELLGNAEGDDLALRALVTRSVRDRGAPFMHPMTPSPAVRTWRCDVANALSALGRPEAFASIARDGIDRDFGDPIEALLKADPERTMGFVERDGGFFCPLSKVAKALSMVAKYGRPQLRGVIRERASPHLRRMMADPILDVRIVAAETLIEWHGISERPLLRAMIAFLSPRENKISFEHSRVLSSFKRLEIGFLRRHGRVQPLELPPLPTTLENAISPLAVVREDARTSKLDQTFSQHLYAQELALTAEAAHARRYGKRCIYDDGVADVEGRIEALRRSPDYDTSRPLTPAFEELLRVGPDAFTAHWAPTTRLCFSHEDAVALAHEEQRLILSDTELAELRLPW